MTFLCAAVDWGTTRFRLWLLNQGGEVVNDVQTDEGLSLASKTGFEPILEKHLKALGAPDDLKIVICGMAGARQGWKEAPYLNTPISPDAIFANAIRLQANNYDIRIMPGVAQNDKNSPDVMRGEETQLLGYLSSQPNSNNKEIVCIPGTHSKWVCVDQNRIEQFSTYITGDLFSAISNHTILSHSMDTNASVEPGQAFISGLKKIWAAPSKLSSELFSLRASHLLGHSSLETVMPELSGMLIGSELVDALPNHGMPDKVTLLGSGKLCDLYETALAERNVLTNRVDAEEAVLSGLRSAANHFWVEN